MFEAAGVGADGFSQCRSCTLKYNADQNSRGVPRGGSGVIPRGIRGGSAGDPGGDPIGIRGGSGWDSGDPLNFAPQKASVFGGSARDQ